ncbi:MAG: dTDP-4-dehydrorhamnose reductase [Desulfovibrionaceae bacterium]
MKKRILLLGGRTGMLSQALAQYLENHAIHYTNLGRNDIDIFSKNALEKIIKNYSPTHIINTIAWTQVDAAEDSKNATFFVNAELPAIIATLAKKYTATLLHYSTDFVFNGKNITPYKETDSPYPLNIYGASKLAGEEAIRTIYKENSYIIRTSWLFGEGKNNFITTVLRLLREKKTISIVADQVGSPTYTQDLAKATNYFLNTSQCLPHGIYHICNKGETSWYHLASFIAYLYSKIKEESFSVIPILSREYFQKAKRPLYSCLDTQFFTEQTQHTMPHWREALFFYLHRIQYNEYNMD